MASKRKLLHGFLDLQTRSMITTVCFGEHIPVPWLKSMKDELLLAKFAYFAQRWHLNIWEGRIWASIQDNLVAVQVLGKYLKESSE